MYLVVRLYSFIVYLDKTIMNTVLQLRPCGIRQTIHQKFVNTNQALTRVSYYTMMYKKLIVLLFITKRCLIFFHGAKVTKSRSSDFANFGLHFQNQLLMRLFLCLALLCLFECSQKPVVKDGPFLKGTALGKVGKKLKEASGITRSYTNAGMLWSHNDSGNPAEVFLIDSAAKIKMICTLKDLKNRDWEDITSDRDPLTGKNYIYVGDIGDNLARYQTKLIYRFEEPLFDSKVKTITEFDTLMVQLPDGVRDTEAMMIDPSTHNLYLVSKREDAVSLYELNYPYAKDTTIAKVATLDLTQIVAADISEDGSEVIMKNYEFVYYWKRNAGQRLATLLQQPPQLLPYAQEAQGEAICFTSGKQGYYTLSEGTKNTVAELMFYKRK